MNEIRSTSDRLQNSCGKGGEKIRKGSGRFPPSLNCSPASLSLWLVALFHCWSLQFPHSLAVQSNFGGGRRDGKERNKQGGAPRRGKSSRSLMEEGGGSPRFVCSLTMSNKVGRWWDTPRIPSFLISLEAHAVYSRGNGVSLSLSRDLSALWPTRERKDDCSVAASGKD